MSDNSSQNDPSMKEILGSIRRIISEDVFCAISMMHIKIHYGNSSKLVFLFGIGSCNSNIIK